MFTGVAAPPPVQRHYRNRNDCIFNSQDMFSCAETPYIAGIGSPRRTSSVMQVFYRMADRGNFEITGFLELQD